MRPFKEEDSADLFRLNADPEVIRYTGDPPFSNEQEALEFIRAYDHYEKWGHGRYTVLLAETGLFLGWCGLKWNSDIHEVDLGYRFLREHWGKGYATEAASASLVEAYDQLGYKSVIGRAMVPNIGSIRVLQKLGFQFERYTLCGGDISEQWRHRRSKL